MSKIRAAWRRIVHSTRRRAKLAVPRWQRLSALERWRCRCRSELGSCASYLWSVLATSSPPGEQSSARPWAPAPLSRFEATRRRTVRRPSGLPIALQGVGVREKVALCAISVVRARNAALRPIGFADSRRRGPDTGISVLAGNASDGQVGAISLLARPARTAETGLAA